MKRLVPIKCELRQSPREKKVFHLVELKTGKEKLVAFGGIFPLKASKKLMHELQNDYGVKVTNLHDFYKEVRKQVKEGVLHG